MPSKIKAYYDEVASKEAEGGELIPAVTLPPLPPDSSPALDRLIEWGRERKVLLDIMARAEASHIDCDAAMEALVRKFPARARTRRVRVPEELIRKYADGNIHNLTFGVQDIGSDEQLDQLQKRVDWAQKYFPDIALYTTVDSKTGTKTALVMGIEANIFNSVVKAESKRQQLNAAVRQACKELKVPEEWVDRKIEASNKAGEKPVAKAMAPKKTPGRKPS